MKMLFMKKYFVYGGKCLSYKAVYNRVEKFSQKYSKVVDDARPVRPVEIATEATVQRTRVEAGSNTSTVTLRVVRGDEMRLKKAAP
jgi:hypothetical protein